MGNEESQSTNDAGKLANTSIQDTKSKPPTKSCPNQKHLKVDTPHKSNKECHKKYAETPPESTTGYGKYNDGNHEHKHNYSNTTENHVSNEGSSTTYIRSRGGTTTNEERYTKHESETKEGFTTTVIPTKHCKRKIFDFINAECQHIALVCEKNEDLEKLQTKLAIVELQTYGNVHYSKKCGHRKCENPAPKGFPKRDIYLCPTHLLETGQHFYHQIYNIKTTADKISKDGTVKEKKIFNEAFSALQAIKSSFNGSLNIKTKQPKQYWSLLMTKLLITIKHVKMDKNNKSTQQLLENVVQLLILYRYVMNPTGLEILALIVAVIKAVTLIVTVSVALIKTLDEMIKAVRSSVVFGYSVAFMSYMVQRVTTNAVVVGGTAMISSGAVGMAAGGGMIASSVSSGATGGAAFGPGGVLIGAGFGLLTGGIILLVKKYRAAPERAVISIIEQQQQNIEAINNIDDLDQLKYLRKQLKQQQMLNGDTDSESESGSDNENDSNIVSNHSNEMVEGFSELQMFFESELHLPEYSQVVVNNGFECIEELYDITSDDLKEMGITKLSHRKVILKQLKRRRDCLNQHQ